MKRLTLIILFLIPGTVSAATVVLAPEPVHIGIGDTIEVTISVNSDVPVNAFSGILHTGNGMGLESVSDGSSIVSAWITRPALSKDGNISFAGITPGGFRGYHGKLFSIVLRARASGTQAISLSTLEVLRNDGAGTKEPTRTEPLILYVAPFALGGFAEKHDREAPEAFPIYAGTDQQEFGGKNYIVFSAADKLSGIDRYEIIETRLPIVLMPHWIKAESPHILKDQYGTSDTYVKAIDRVGNERLAELPRAHIVRPYELAILLIVFLIVCILFISNIKKSRQRRQIRTR